jgi:hypothetical protein
MITTQNFIHIHESVQNMNPPHKLKCSPCWKGGSYRIKKYGVEDTFNVITSIQKFHPNHQSVQKLSGGFFAPT